MTRAHDLAEALRRGDRRVLARAITLVESDRADHQELSEKLLGLLLPHTGGGIRVGITGPPGAGKSTFIERFGLDGIARGHSIAVLAVDPASQRGGGAILADKTRMPELSHSAQAFVRPSSAGASHGGAARRTGEAMLLCEAAGFDTVIVESVGVGQSETAVAALTDIFVLILPPAAGDELQGLKRGIVELADLVLVNKADGELVEAAGRTAADYASALRLFRARIPRWDVPVRLVSALEGRGIAEIWDDVARFRQLLQASGAWTARRRDKARAALWSEIEHGLIQQLRAAPSLAKLIASLEADVAAGALTPAAAASAVVTAFLNRN